MKVEWTKETPQHEGVFWIKYKDKHNETILRTCTVMHFDKDKAGRTTVVNTSGNDSFIEGPNHGGPGLKYNGKLCPDIRFGPEIPAPDDTDDFDDAVKHIGRLCDSLLALNNNAKGSRKKRILTALAVRGLLANMLIDLDKPLPKKEAPMTVEQLVGDLCFYEGSKPVHGYIGTGLRDTYENVPVELTGGMIGDAVIPDESPIIYFMGTPPGAK